MIVNEPNFDLERIQSANELKADEKFIPCPVNKGDELFSNGIFVFNITKMLEHIKNHPNEFELIEVTVADFHSSFSSVDASHVDSVDVSQAVLLAEISPGHYNLIDDQPRVNRRVVVNQMVDRSLMTVAHQYLLPLDLPAKFPYRWIPKSSPRSSSCCFSRLFPSLLLSTLR